MADKAHTNISDSSNQNGGWWIFALATVVAAIVGSAMGKQLLGLSLVVLGQLPVALAIFLAGGGWGKLIFGRLTDCCKSKPLNYAAATALGLWAMSTAMLILGSLSELAMSAIFWQGVIACGCGILIWNCRKVNFSLTANKTDHNTTKYITIIILGICAGLWLGGVVLPAGKVGIVTKDFYDVESYHLQLPREYFDNGRITALPHNTYSNFPLGCEMIYLVAMCFKASNQEALYAAKLTSGLWAIIAAMAIVGSCELVGVKHRRIAAAFFLSCPIVLYLSWLAFVEMAQCAFMAVGFGFLLYNVSSKNLKPLIVSAIACGAACCVKYLSVGLVFAPLVFVILLDRYKIRTKLSNAIIFSLITLAAFSPWLIRNFVYTGNPAFPLATGIFGGGHWDATQEAKWNAGHAPLAWANKLSHLANPLIELRGFGLVLCLLAIAGILIRGKYQSDSQKYFKRTATIVLLAQILVWLLATHMPVRFLTVALIPITLLAGLFIEQVGSKISIALLSVCCGAGLIQSTFAIGQERSALQSQGINPYALAGISTEQFLSLNDDTPYGQRSSISGCRFLLVGDIRPLYLPEGTLYASIWEKSLLEKILAETGKPENIVQILKEKYNVTDILINRKEILRIKSTYGWPDEINESLFDILRQSAVKSIEILPPDKGSVKPAVEILVLQ